MIEGKVPSWTEKYRPRTLDEMAGMVKTAEALRRWASSWKGGLIPKKKGIILDGEPGVGKTTAAYALAREMGWEVIELNASDSRNMESIRNLVTRGAMSYDITDSTGYDGSSEMKKKLIVLDEADNLYERGASGSDGSDVSDKGGKRAIVELVKLTLHPVVLIVNNLYNLTKGSGASLNFTCEKMKFRRLGPASVSKRLREICGIEGIHCDEELIQAISERSGGDLRSAVGDLQIVCAGKGRATMKDIEVLGYRDTKENIFTTLERVFNARSISASRSALMDVDEDISSLVLWFSQNITSAMSHPEDVARGMDSLSKADVFLGRVRRRQNYKLWSYAKDHLSSICLARTHPNPARSRYQFPTYLKKMSKTKDSRKLLKETSSALGSLTHTSIREIKESSLHHFGVLVKRDMEFAAQLVAHSGIGRDHLKILSGSDLSDPEIRKIISRAEKIIEETSKPMELDGESTGGLMDYDSSPAPSESQENVEPQVKEEEENEDGPKQTNLFDF